MGYSAHIIAKYDGYDYKPRLEVIKNAMIKYRNYILCTDKEYYINIYVAEYHMSESDVLMNLYCNADECHIEFQGDEENYIGAIFFECLNGMDLILKLLYEYFQYFPEDCFYDWDNCFYKEDIDRIYNSDDWEDWVCYNPRGRVLRSLSEQEPLMQIRQPLKRNGRNVVILRKVEKFNFDELREHIIEFVNDNEYRYYTSERQEDCDFFSTHYMIDVDTGEKTGNLLEFDLNVEVNSRDEGMFNIIENDLCIAMTIRYSPGGEENVKKYMQKYFEKYPDDYVWQSTTYRFTRKEDHVYAKDTISTFGE